MGNYEELKQAVADVIKSNGNQEITGAILQNALLTIISTVGSGATFAGIAKPTTNPGTPDQNVFYIASEDGTYSNFNGVMLNNEVAILSNKNGSWVKTNTRLVAQQQLSNLEKRNINIKAYPRADTIVDFIEEKKYYGKVTVVFSNMYDNNSPIILNISKTGEVAPLLSEEQIIDGKASFYIPTNNCLVCTKEGNYAVKPNPDIQSEEYVLVAVNSGYVRDGLLFPTYVNINLSKEETIENANEIKDIKDVLYKNYQYVKSNNIIDTSTVIANRYINRNGDIDSTSGDKYFVSDYIEAKDDISVLNSAFDGNSIGTFVVYDASKTKIRTLFATNKYIKEEDESFVRIGFQIDRCINDEYKGFFANYGLTLKPYDSYQLADFKKGLIEEVVNINKKFPISAKDVVFGDINYYNITPFLQWGTPSEIGQSGNDFSYIVPTGAPGDNVGIKTPIFTPKGENLVTIKLALKHTTDSINYNTKLYVFGKTVGFLQAWDNIQDGEHTLQFDAASYTVYKGETDFYIIVATLRDSTIIKVEGSITVFESNDMYDDTYEAVKDVKNDVETLKEEIANIGIADNVMLKSPNGKRFYLSVSNDGILKAVSVIPNNVLFLGNSLLFGRQEYGMDASNKNNDYYYHITTKITELLSDEIPIFNKLYSSPFEHSETEEALQEYFDDLIPMLNSDIEWVSIQLGDNVNTPAKLEIFKTSAKRLLSTIREYAPNAIISWAFAWFYNTERENIVREACTEYGATYISIKELSIKENRSYIGSLHKYDTEQSYNIVYDEYSVVSVNKLNIKFSVTGVQYTTEIDVISYEDVIETKTLRIKSMYQITTNSGVASHPGDKGFQLIADKILRSMGIVE